MTQYEGPQSIDYNERVQPIKNITVGVIAGTITLAFEHFGVIGNVESLKDITTPQLVGSIAVGAAVGDAIGDGIRRHFVRKNSSAISGSE